MIAVIDYDAGNIKSVVKALEAMGREVVITPDRERILSADHVILPGVGAFADAMGRLRERGLDQVISEVVRKKTPFLGICLGLQLLFDSSEESPGVTGLGICKGSIARLPDRKGYKIPQIGWNALNFPAATGHSLGGRLYEGIKEGAFVYFVHSYYLKAKEDIVTATTEYTTTIHASIEKDNVFACQFHPEKSSDVGMQILHNFIKIQK